MATAERGGPGPQAKGVRLLDYARRAGHLLRSRLSPESLRALRARPVVRRQSLVLCGIPPGRRRSGPGEVAPAQALHGLTSSMVPVRREFELVALPLQPRRPMRQVAIADNHPDFALPRRRAKS